MNKLLSTIFLVFAIAVNANAQRECKYHIEKKDPFTEEKIENSESIRVSRQDLFGPTLTLWRQGEKYWLIVEVGSFGANETVLTEGKMVKFKFSNGKVLDLRLSTDVRPTLGQYSTNVCTKWSLKLEMEEFQFKDFARSKLTAVNCVTPGGNELYADLAEKYTTRVLNHARCFFPGTNFDEAKTE